MSSSSVAHGIVSTNESGWEVLRKEARRLESEIDSKLVTYASLSSRPEQGTKPMSSGNKSFVSEEYKISSEIEQLLRKLGQVNESMGRFLASSSATSLSQSHALQRHQEILSDYIQEFRKVKATLRNMVEKQELLETSQRNSVPASPNLSSQEGFLLKERNAISNSDRGADLAINQGLAVKEDLARQRQVFASMVSRMEHVSERLPRLNRLIGQIRRRKRRDLIILCCVMSLLMVVTLFWRMF
eukprot:jgi/Galph1/1112/GphlegSOOS_G5855.1